MDTEAMLSEAKRMLHEDLLSPQEYAQKVVEIHNLNNGITRIDESEKRRLQAAYAKSKQEKQRSPHQGYRSERQSLAPIASVAGALLISVAAFYFWSPELNAPASPNSPYPLDRHDSPVRVSPKAKAIAPKAEQLPPKASTAAEQLFMTAKMAADEHNIKRAKETLLQLAEKYACSAVKNESGRRLANQMAILNQTLPISFLNEVNWLHGDVTTSTLHQGAKFLVFWELWCPHCIKEVPELQIIASTTWSGAIDIIGLTQLTKTTTKQQAIAFLKSQNVTYPNAHENGDISNALGIEGIPAATYLYDGKILWQGHPALRDEALFKDWSNGVSLPDFGIDGLDFLLAYEGYQCETTSP